MPTWAFALRWLLFNCDREVAAKLDHGVFDGIKACAVLREINESLRYRLTYADDLRGFPELQALAKNGSFYKFQTFFARGCT